MAKTDLAHWRKRIFKQPNSANWFAEISARGVRRKLSLETPNPGKRKFDPHGGGHREWVERVNAVKLANLTSQKIQQWKRSFLSNAASDPISQRSAKTTVNTYLRQARSLFSRTIIKHLGEVSLPDPLPFSDVEFEPRQTLKYRTTFDVQNLIAKDFLLLSV